MFDTIVVLGNNLGLLGNRKDATVILERLAAVAAPGARLIGSETDPYATDNDEHHAYHAWNRQRGRMPGQLTLRVRDGRVATDWFDYLLLSESELAKIVTGSPSSLHSIKRDTPNYAVRLCLR